MNSPGIRVAADGERLDRLEAVAAERDPQVEWRQAASVGQVESPVYPWSVATLYNTKHKWSMRGGGALRCVERENGPVAPLAGGEMRSVQCLAAAVCM
jgi:hypothetical protein